MGRGVSASKPAARKRVSLALQGGGALGAYTWGVLDAILEDDRLEVAAISGASAGAMNAVAFAHGFESGGAEGARKSLRAFWRGVSEAGLSNPYRRSPLMAFMNSFTPEWARMPFSPLAMWADIASRVASPYDLNPLNINPLKELLDEIVDFEAVRRCGKIQLFVSATHVQTGRIRVFGNGELTADHVMASACLPMVFQAVEIDGEPYWDGGYMGNPALFPLFDVDHVRDLIIVQLNPIEREGAPRTAPEIIARVNEITFNSSLLRELRAIEFVARLVDEGRVPEERYHKMLVHRINATAASQLGLGVDLNTDWSFFERLNAAGREDAKAWLKENFEAIGDHGTVDLRALFEGERGPPHPKAAKGAQ